LRKRFWFHLGHFLVLVTVVVLAIAVYRFPLVENFSDLISRTQEFIRGYWPNLALMVGMTYFMIYLSGLSFAGCQPSARFSEYFNALFKLVLILGMASFIEFFVFFSTKVGRRIYIYIFLFMALFYLSRFLRRSRWNRTDLLWLVRQAPGPFMERYPILGAKFRALLPDETASSLSGCDVVVYQREELSDPMAERLIRSKLEGRLVVELNHLVEREEERIPLNTVSIDWLLVKLNRVHRLYLRASRWANLVVASLLLLILLPPAFLMALLHCLLSPGPLLYTQARMGLNQRPFRIYKFRSMCRDAEKGGACFADKREKRINRIGNFMRRFRLDEVPQLLNVIRGEMNLVGPRPEREVFIKSLENILPFYRLRLLVKPGLTGWAQVKMGYAGDEIAKQRSKLEYDLYYVKNRSFALDLLVLVKTLPVVLGGKGR